MSEKITDVVENSVKETSTILIQFNSFLKEYLSKEGIGSCLDTKEKVNTGDADTIEKNKSEKPRDDSCEEEVRPVDLLTDSPKFQRKELSNENKATEISNLIDIEPSANDEHHLKEWFSQKHKTAEDDKVIALAMGSNMICTLQSHFGIIFPAKLGEELDVALPIQLARQLYSYIIDALYQETEPLNEIPASINDVPDFRETIDNELATNLQVDPKKMKLPSSEALTMVETFRDLARMHHDLKSECFIKSQKSSQCRNKSITSYYSEMANWHKKQIDEANTMAVTTLLRGVDATSKTLDLHFMYVKEALLVLDMFLDTHIKDLNKSSNNKRWVRVITGRGIHSKGGVSKLLPAVKKRLQERDIWYDAENPGMLKLLITKEGLVRNKLNIINDLNFNI